MTKIYLKNDHCPACKSEMEYEYVPPNTAWNKPHSTQWYQCVNKDCALLLPHAPENDRHNYCPDCFTTMEWNGCKELNPTTKEIEREFYCPDCDNLIFESQTNHA